VLKKIVVKIRKCNWRQIKSYKQSLTNNKAANDEKQTALLFINKSCLVGIKCMRTDCNICAYK